MKATRAGLKRTAAYIAVGGLSEPSKMPCYGYSIPATRCKIGAKLREVKGSTCNSCYALKGRYVFPNVVTAMERRYRTLDDLDVWAYYMVRVMLYLRDLGETHFRWHDSGDVQSVAHLRAISEVARAVPEIQHWLPTREYAIVRQYLKADTFPPNLTVRLSAHMVGKPAPDMGLPTSEVTRDEPTCPSKLQHGKCGDCRACWNPAVPVVTYGLH